MHGSDSPSSPGYWGYLADPALVDKVISFHIQMVQPLALDIDGTLLETCNLRMLREWKAAAK